MKNRDDLDKVNDLALLQNQIKSLSLQDKLEKQNFRDNFEKRFEPVTKTIKDSNEDAAKALTVTSRENSKAFPVSQRRGRSTNAKINEKLLAIIFDRGSLDLICCLFYLLDLICCLFYLKSLTPNEFANLN